MDGCIQRWRLYTEEVNRDHKIALQIFAMSDQGFHEKCDIAIMRWAPDCEAVGRMEEHMTEALYRQGAYRNAKFQFCDGLSINPSHFL